MNVVEQSPAAQDNRVLNPLAPPMRLETGTIVTLRMRGHTRTQGREYYAPAVVLNQYANPTGDVEVLIWDSTAGTHYNPAYPIRELSARGDGLAREMYESQSNIGQVLFSPDQFMQMAVDVETLQHRMRLAEDNVKLLGLRIAALVDAKPPMAGSDGAKIATPAPITEKGK